ncbi:MAG: GlyGly-CTERM sorting domain-containing protein, partial [Plesiomonas shigelloides]
NCGTNVPSVYTRITSYLSWISGIQDGSITEVYAPSGGSGGGTVTPPTTDNCQIGGGIECGPGEGGGSFPLWIALFLPLIYVLRRRKHA